MKKKHIIILLFAFVLILMFCYFIPVYSGSSIAKDKNDCFVRYLMGDNKFFTEIRNHNIAPFRDSGSLIGKLTLDSSDNLTSLNLQDMVILDEPINSYVMNERLLNEFKGMSWNDKPIYYATGVSKDISKNMYFQLLWLPSNIRNNKSYIIYCLSW